MNDDIIVSMNKKKAVEEKRGGLVCLIAKWVALVAQVAISVMSVLSMISMGVLKTWIIVAIAAGLLILFVINLTFLVLRKKTGLVMNIVCLIIVILVIVAGVVAMRYTGAFNSFLGRITDDRKELKEYSVLVLENSEIKEVQELRARSAGFLSTDTTAEQAEEVLKQQVGVNTSVYGDVDIMSEMMSGGLLDAMVLESSRMEAMKEDAVSLFNDKRVIYTFTIELVGTDDDSAIKKEVTKEPFLIYISGSDSRSGIKTTARSDVNILAAVNPQTGKILLVSIPRDTYVQLHGTTGLKDKLTHAGLYGIEMSKTTIEDLLGVNIDYTIKVGFDAVVRVVDELNGIEIDSDVAMTLGAFNGKQCTYIKGRQWVDGDCALRFARERKTYGTGDIHRGENQQQVISAIITKMSSSKDYFLKLPELLDAAADLFETSLSKEEITEFIRMQLANQTKWQTESMTVNGVADMQPTYSMGANLPLYVMYPNEDSIKEAQTKINGYLNTNR